MTRAAMLHSLTLGGNYLTLLRRLDALGLIRPGEWRQVSVRHDADCGVFRGQPCGCAPEVYVAEKRIIAPLD